MKYNISEIFYSIQGEGFHSGTAAWFIRLAGCNLHCDWCDTNHDIKMKLDENEIVQQIKNPPLFVVITGGEPTIQDLIPLCTKLKEKKFYIALETNGTNYLALSSLRKLNIIDWITISPKNDNIKETSVFMANEIKVVYDGKINPNKIPMIKYKQHKYIQPCSENYDPAVKYVLENPEWKLSVQIQKILNIK